MVPSRSGAALGWTIGQPDKVGAFVMTAEWISPRARVCEHALALAKTKEVAFVRLMMRLLLALLKVNVVFTRCAHSASATAALTSTRKQRQQKAIPTVCARGSPAVDSGSACVRQESSGKASAARASSVAAPVAFWSLEMRTRLCLSAYHLCSSPTLLMERRRVQTSTQPPSAQTQTHALFSFISSDRADISAFLCWHTGSHCAGETGALCLRVHVLHSRNGLRLASLLWLSWIKDHLWLPSVILEANEAAITSHSDLFLQIKTQLSCFWSHACVSSGNESAWCGSVCSGVCGEVGPGWRLDGFNWWPAALVSVSSLLSAALCR